MEDFLQPTSAMWHIAFKEAEIDFIRPRLAHFEIKGFVYVFRVDKEHDGRVSRIVVTDLINFFYITENSAKRHFTLTSKSNEEFPESLFHVKHDKFYKIAR